MYGQYGGVCLSGGQLYPLTAAQATTSAEAMRERARAQPRCFPLALLPTHCLAQEADGVGGGWTCAHQGLMREAKLVSNGASAKIGQR
jgi:hypothetical protein